MAQHLETTPKGILKVIGNTPMLKLESLSKLTGCNILLKCEHLNPGGSVKDRAALGMILEAEKRGELKKGKTIVEGTAGNTGIGLALVGRALGYEVKVVMPNNQAKEKTDNIELHGAELILVDPCPFKNQNHFYHSARRIAEEDPKQYWWANQFENTDNSLIHELTTGPEIFEQTDGEIDILVSVAGTGGTIGGTSRYLKKRNPNIKVYLTDPGGSGLCSYFHTGEFKSEGSSITEGIGIMRLVANFAGAKVDDAFSIGDDLMTAIAYYVRDNDSILLGSSAALNVAGALKAAFKEGPGKTIVTFICDGGQRSASKLYNSDFLKEKGLDPYAFAEKDFKEALS